MAGNGSVFHASAPVRLDFAGGWTDVAPFAVRERGAVVNAAIDLRAVARVEPGGEGYRLTSDDLGETLELASLERVAANGRLALLRAAVHRSGLPGGSVHTRCQVPPGSGLGSSGALDVALLAALDAAGGIRRTAVELAEAGWELETVDAGLPGGKQDQYAAALGGFHHFQFEHGRVDPTALALAPGLERELEQRILVCYTGNSRVSSDTIARVMSRYEAGDPEVVDALRTMAGLADRMADALREGRLATIGELLSRNWTAQQRLDPGMRTESMARLEAAMRGAQSLGGKAAGAGAGGSMFFLIGGSREAAARAAREAGATVLPFVWAAEGVHVW
jgi:D-glycero-alpha-D-manno-heptose-7-phosphate kinase